MRVLIDTHVFLWWVEGDRALPAEAHELLSAPENDCLLSMVSAWELTIKAELGKLRLAVPVSRYITEQVAANGFRLLGIELRHLAGLEGLSFHHRDPFDRLLVAQALVENLPVITADSIFEAYGVDRIRA
jgi:PIN domain nuclease of toxin-antitoxin system